jgi:hypothetical protein
MNTKQALTLDPFPILDFKEASKKLRDIKIMQICEKYQMKKKKKKKKLFLVGWWVVEGGRLQFVAMCGRRHRWLGASPDSS